MSTSHVSTISTAITAIFAGMEGNSSPFILSTNQSGWYLHTSTSEKYLHNSTTCRTCNDNQIMSERSHNSRCHTAPLVLPLKYAMVLFGMCEGSCLSYLISELKSSIWKVLNKSGIQQERLLSNRNTQLTKCKVLRLSIHSIVPSFTSWGHGDISRIFPGSLHVAVAVVWAEESTMVSGQTSCRAMSHVTHTHGGYVTLII